MFIAPARDFLTQSFKEGCKVYWTLLRLALPLLVCIRLLDVYFDLIARLGDWLAPFMNLVGLPGQAGIVMATGFLLQIYAAAILMATLWTTLSLNEAQLTILMTMLLIAHSLPVESRIVQKAGVPASYTLLLRLGGAFLLGWILHAIYGDEYLQDEVALPFVAEADDSWSGWAIGLVKNWALLFVIVQCVLLFVNVLRYSHIEQQVIRLLLPLTRLVGVGKKTVTLFILGMFLGISYSGGLLIEESRKSDVNRRDVFFTLSLLCLCHSVVEDTLLAIFLGAHVSGVLFARVIFSLALIVLLNKLLPRDFLLTPQKRE